MPVPTVEPIVDYPSLLGSIAAWVDRTDFGIVAPILVGLAHARLNRTLRVQDMLKRSTAPFDAGSEYLDLPDDFVEMKRARPLTSPPARPLRVMTTDQMAERLGENVLTSQLPTEFALVGSMIQVAPPPLVGFTLELLYYGTIAPLSTLAPTNWLLTKYPGAYLFGALTESAPYLRDDDRMPLWKGRFEEIINEIQGASDRADLAGGKMVNRTGPLA